MPLRSIKLSENVKDAVINDLRIRSGRPDLVDDLVDQLGKDKIVDAYINGIEQAISNRSYDSYPYNEYSNLNRSPLYSYPSYYDWIPWIVISGVILLIGAIGFGLWKAWPWLAGAVYGWVNWLGGHF